MTKPHRASLQPTLLEIPDHWNPETALAVFELIDDLRDKIWAIYDCQVQALLREQCADRRAGDGNANLDERSF